MTRKRTKGKSTKRPLPDAQAEPASVHRGNSLIKLSRNGTFVDGWIVLGLLCFLIFQAFATWRKWPDPLIDFGRELYVPWQIANGATLYQDIVHYYGPLGVSINATLFQIFGTGFSTLFLFSLILLTLVTVVLFFFLKQISNRMAAALAVFLFLCAFAFGNFVGIGNYNFIAPYSFDTVYGTYLCLGLIVVFWRWFIDWRKQWLIFAGVLFAGAYLTKPEITAAATAITGLAFCASLVVRRQEGASFGGLLVSVMIFVVSALVPLTLVNLWFASRIPGVDGWLSIHSAWAAIFGTSTLRNSLTNLTFMGMDRPAENLQKTALASAWAFASVAVVFALALLAGRTTNRAPFWRYATAGLLFAFTGWLIFTLSENFLQVGSILVFASMAVFTFRAVVFLKDRTANGGASVLWSAFGLAMLLKMFFNPRIEHYGFFQAMPATLDIVLFLVSDIPRLQARFRGSQSLARVATGVLVFSIAIGLFLQAHQIWNLKTFKVGSGADEIRTFDGRVMASGPLVNELYKEVTRNHSDAKSLMVFPEGVSLNYLLRLKNPTPLFEFVPPALAFYGNDRLLSDMASAPPDLIVILSRDIQEFGSPVFGYDEASGKSLISWIAPRYTVVATVGGNPLNPSEAGAFLLKRLPPK